MHLDALITSAQPQIVPGLRSFEDELSTKSMFQEASIETYFACSLANPLCTLIDELMSGNKVELRFSWIKFRSVASASLANTRWIQGVLNSQLIKLATYIDSGSVP